jgi:glycosyltransferase involved in cell wall biosynthesis
MTNDSPGSVAVVNAFKAHTGSSSVARSYYDALRTQNLEVNWYQCRSSRDEFAYDQMGVPIDGYKIFRDDLNLVVNSLFVFPRKVGRLKEDLTILTDPVLLGAAPRLSSSTVIVHDLREFVSQRRSWAAGAYFRWLFRRLDDARHVICDSEATRTELLRFHRTEVSVDVIHPCSRVRGDPAAHVERTLARSAQARSLNMLYIAADRPYKNVASFCRLAKLLETPREGWNFHFRLISRVGPASAQEIGRLHASNLEVIPALSDVGSAYDWADVLVHPALVEGFGLPPVEAMQFGIPIIASDVPCLREVIDGGGVLLDPSDPEQWMKSLTDLTDPAVYLKRADASMERGKEFTPAAFGERLRSWIQSRMT